MANKTTDGHSRVSQDQRKGLLFYERFKDRVRESGLTVSFIIKKTGLTRNDFYYKFKYKGLSDSEIEKINSILK